MPDIASVALSAAMIIGPVVGYVDQVRSLINNIMLVPNLFKYC